jgi:hypothetical protein
MKHFIRCFCILLENSRRALKISFMIGQISKLPHYIKDEQLPSGSRITAPESLPTAMSGSGRSRLALERPGWGAIDRV